MITQNDLKKRLCYDPKTGIFTRLVRCGNQAGGKVAGTPHKKGYISIGFSLAGVKKIYLAHRLAWLYVFGEMPDGQIDHINGDKTDNRIENLRVVNHLENHKNTKLHSRNKSGLSGVWFHGQNKNWCAEIKVNNKKIGLGSHSGFFDACCARKSAERRFGFHMNHGRQN